MPPFYFDVREGAEVTPDYEGLVFGSLEAAEYEAARAAAEIGRDDLPKGKARDVTVDVRDEHGQQVFTVTVRRMNPAHAKRSAIDTSWNGQTQPMLYAEFQNKDKLFFVPGCLAIWQPTLRPNFEGEGMTLDISFLPMRVLIDDHDTDGRLVLADNQLAAVFVRLDGTYHDPEHKGWWHLEAGFGKCNIQHAPLFTLAAIPTSFHSRVPSRSP